MGLGLEYLSVRGVSDVQPGLRTPETESSIFCPKEPGPQVVQPSFERREKENPERISDLPKITEIVNYTAGPKICAL